MQLIKLNHPENSTEILHKVPLDINLTLAKINARNKKLLTADQFDGLPEEICFDVLIILNNIVSEMHLENKLR